MRGRKVPVGPAPPTLGTDTLVVPLNCRCLFDLSDLDYGNGEVAERLMMNCGSKIHLYECSSKTRPVGMWSDRWAGERSLSTCVVRTNQSTDTAEVLTFTL